MMGMGAVGFLIVLVGLVQANAQLIMVGAFALGLPSLITATQPSARERIPTIDLRQHAKTH